MELGRKVAMAFDNFFYVIVNEVQILLFYLLYPFNEYLFCFIYFPHVMLVVLSRMEMDSFL